MDISTILSLDIDEREPYLKSIKYLLNKQFRYFHSTNKVFYGYIDLLDRGMVKLHKTEIKRIISEYFSLKKYLNSDIEDFAKKVVQNEYKINGFGIVGTDWTALHLAYIVQFIRDFEIQERL